MIESKVIKSDVHLPFMLAGNALFKVYSSRTNTSVIYQITSSKDTDLWFVSVQYEYNNTADVFNTIKFAYIGTITGRLNFKHTKGSKVASTSKTFKGFAWLWECVTSNKLPDFIHISHMTRCAKCGRRLKTPESIARGFGPSCWKSVSKKVKDLTTKLKEA